MDVQIPTHRIPAAAGQVLMADLASPGGVKFASAPGAGGLISRYTAPVSNLAYAKPLGAFAFLFRVAAGAGGGGGGRRGAAGTVRSGGAGGTSGSYSELWVKATDLPDTFYLTVGNAGTPGLAATVNDTDGGAGGNGGNSWIATSNVTFDITTAIIAAVGGNGGGGGTALGATPGNFGSGMYTGMKGGAGSATGGAGSYPVLDPNVPRVGAGGSSGGGITAANAQSAGAAGLMIPGVTISGAAAGAAGGGAGGSGQDTGYSIVPGGSGAGGGSNLTGAGGAGGAGGRAAGGGGGGASVNGSNSGAGGAGGAGFIEVICFV